MIFIKKFRFIILLLLLIFAAWCSGAAFYLFNWGSPLSILFAATLAIMAAYGIFHPAAWIPLLIAEISVLIFFTSLTPEDVFADVKWRRECAHIPSVTYLHDGKVKICNVRSFTYRTPGDFDIKYLDKIYDPAAINSLDIALSYWDDMKYVAHTLLCFNFNDGTQLALSLEPRLPEGVRGGDFFLGIYKRYAQYLLLATPEDVFNLRSRYRREAFFRYRTAASPELCRKIFMKVIARADALSKNAEFYNSISANCTTGIFKIAADEVPQLNSDPRLILNGLSDKMLFDKGFLHRNAGESFDRLRARSFVGQ